MPRIPNNPTHNALVRELRKTTDYSDKSLRTWIANGTGPQDPYGRPVWDAAVAAARTKLGLDGSASSEVTHAG